MTRALQPNGLVPWAFHWARRFWVRAGRALTLCVGVAILIGLVALLLGPVALWATPERDVLQGKDIADTVNATRQILLASVGGLALLTGASYAARTFYLSRRGQLTDRYTKAIGLLASDRLAERLGGVYALEHLMIESGRDHETVVEVLAAFVRDRTASTDDDQPRDAEHRHESGNNRPRVQADVQAALTVIGRRPRRPERNALDLSHADLCGADLSGLNFDAAYFENAKLRSADMQKTRLNEAFLCFAQLQDADLTGAYLKGAALILAQLHGASLYDAQLQRVGFGEAQLQDARLAGANLEGAILEGAQFQGADFLDYPFGRFGQHEQRPSHGLTVEQLSTAVIDDTTHLPDELRGDGWDDDQPPADSAK